MTAVQNLETCDAYGDGWGRACEALQNTAIPVSLENCEATQETDRVAIIEYADNLVGITQANVTTASAVSTGIAQYIEYGNRYFR